MLSDNSRKKIVGTEFPIAKDIFFDGRDTLNLRIQCIAKDTGKRMRRTVEIPLCNGRRNIFLETIPPVTTTNPTAANDITTSSILPVSSTNISQATDITTSSILPVSSTNISDTTAKNDPITKDDTVINSISTTKILDTDLAIGTDTSTTDAISNNRTSNDISTKNLESVNEITNTDFAIGTDSAVINSSMVADKSTQSTSNTFQAISDISTKNLEPETNFVTINAPNDNNSNYSTIMTTKNLVQAAQVTSIQDSPSQPLETTDVTANFDFTNLVIVLKNKTKQSISTNDITSTLTTTSTIQPSDLIGSTAISSTPTNTDTSAVTAEQAFTLQYSTPKKNFTLQTEVLTNSTNGSILGAQDVILANNGTLILSDTAMQVLFDNNKNDTTQLILNDPKTDLNSFEENFDIEQTITTKVTSNTTFTATTIPYYEIGYEFIDGILFLNANIL